MSIVPRPCVVIPTYNHGLTVRDIAAGASRHFPVIVVDDGSTDGTAEELRGDPRLTIVPLPENRGKGAALRAGFAEARRQGFTHAITMDADGQHFPDALPGFAGSVRAHPDALIVGVRDLRKAGAPVGRRLANGISTFWFKATTGVRIRDTQCGFRCYPLGPTGNLRVKAGRYAFELEVLVRAAWAGVPLVETPVEADYQAATSRLSHFRPFVDILRMSSVHARLACMAFCVPRALLAMNSKDELGDMPFTAKVKAVLGHFFKEHTETPLRVALAVGLGFFCGIAPIWGYQMVTAALVAHKFRLNKAIALTASNISFPLLAPFILAASLVFGHYLRTGDLVRFSAGEASRQVPLYIFDWIVGSIALALLAGILGGLATYAIAGTVRRFRRRSTE